MSSAGQPSSSSNFQLIVVALGDYARQTGIDLTKNPFAEKIQDSKSPEAILELLKETEKKFKSHLDVHRKLINCLTPAVKVLHAFSGILSQGVSLVSRKRHIPSCQYFNVTSSGPVRTSKGRVYRH
jgi:hypothetical protein